MFTSDNWTPAVEYWLASANWWRLSISRDTMFTDILCEDEGVRTRSGLDHIHTYVLAKIARQPLRKGWEHPSIVKERRESLMNILEETGRNDCNISGHVKMRAVMRAHVECRYIGQIGEGQHSGMKLGCGTGVD